MHSIKLSMTVQTKKPNTFMCHEVLQTDETEKLIPWLGELVFWLKSWTMAE